MSAPHIGERLCVTVTRRRVETDTVVAARRCGTIVRVEPRLAMRDDESGREVDLPLRAAHLAPEAPGAWRGAWHEVHADTARGSGTFTPGPPPPSPGE